MVKVIVKITSVHLGVFGDLIVDIETTGISIHQAVGPIFEIERDAIRIVGSDSEAYRSSAHHLS